MEQEERQSLLPHDQTTSRPETYYNSVLQTHNNNDDNNDNNNDNNNDDDLLPLFTIVCMLSTAFSYGCILTTLFLITLPVECQRLHTQSQRTDNTSLPKSVALGIFVAIAGVTQLVSPLVGRLSDAYRPPDITTTTTATTTATTAVPIVGQRWPYHFCGSILTVVGLLGQMAASAAGFWMRYGLAFFLHMMGLNIMYAMMLALLADHVPPQQVGVANGVLALELVTGSLFGFGLFHSLFWSSSIQSMYALYACIAIVSSILTGTHAQERDAARAWRRRRRRPTESRISENTRQPATSSSPTTTTTISSSSSRHKWHRRAQKAAQRAGEIVVLTPTQLLQSLLEPLHRLSWTTLLRSYTIDIDQHYDFFMVTVSRLFYYCGMSVQTFFLYFCHDILRVRSDPQQVVATLAILGQASAAFTCYPVGIWSDRVLRGRRKPFVYAACVVLSMTTLAMVHATTVSDMVVLCCILGAANGVYLTMETSLAVDTLPSHHRCKHRSDDHHDEESTSKEGDVAGDDDDDDDSAQLLGIWGVAAFLGSALGPMIGGPLLYYIGRQPAQDPLPADSDDDQEEDMEEYSLAGYAVVLSLSSFYFLCSAWALRYVNKSEE